MVIVSVEMSSSSFLICAETVKCYFQRQSTKKRSYKFIITFIKYNFIITFPNICLRIIVQISFEKFVEIFSYKELLCSLSLNLMNY